MSNQIVGQIYDQVIAKVIMASQNDFEEFGVDQSTLTEMRDAWQQKLSALHVAHFPWDPPAQVQNPPTVPSNVPKTEPSPTPSSAAPPPQPAQNNYSGVHVKSESEYESPVAPYQVNGYASGLDNNRAQQRAHQLVRNGTASKRMLRLLLKT